MTDPKHIVNLHGKDFILFAGLLDAAHQDNLESVDTDLLQIPDDTNHMTAIVKATVKTKKGSFSGIGDANPKNVSMASIALHSIRMAETRAIARALRFATNIGMTSLEELGGDVEGGHDAPPQDVPQMTEKQRGMLEGFSESNWLGEEEQAKLKDWLSKPRSVQKASEAIKHYLELKDERNG